MLTTRPGLQQRQAQVVSALQARFERAFVLTLRETDGLTVEEIQMLASLAWERAHRTLDTAVRFERVMRQGGRES